MTIAKGSANIKNNKILLPTLFILLCSFSLVLFGCDSGSIVEPEIIESEKIMEPDSETADELVVDGYGSFEIERNVETFVKVVVNVDVLRLRSGPSTDHEIIDRLILGTVLEIVDEDGKWLQVRNRSEGWVHGDYVVKPSSPDKLYEVLPVDVQPVGYTKDQVSRFIEESTSVFCDEFVIPEFNNPNNISNEDLIRLITNNGLIPTYYDDYGYLFTVKDMKETALAIFGKDLKEIQYYEDVQVVKPGGHGCGSYTETRVLNFIERENEFVVDVVHIIYYYDPYDEKHISHVTDELSRYSSKTWDSYDDFLDNTITLVDEEHNDGTIDKYLNSFPVRRYILSKEGDGVCYIRQSYLLDD
jgi:hypothetical protein